MFNMNMNAMPFWNNDFAAPRPFGGDCNVGRGVGRGLGLQRGGSNDFNWSASFGARGDLSNLGDLGALIQFLLQTLQGMEQNLGAKPDYMSPNAALPKAYAADAVMVDTMTVDDTLRSTATTNSSTPDAVVAEATVLESTSTTTVTSSAPSSTAVSAAPANTEHASDGHSH